MSAEERLNIPKPASLEAPPQARRRCQSKSGITWKPGAFGGIVVFLVERRSPPATRASPEPKALIMWS